MRSVNIQGQNHLAKRKEIVNRAIKICIECGNLAVHIDNFRLYCDNCNSRFKIEKEENIV